MFSVRCPRHGASYKRTPQKQAVEFSLRVSSPLCYNNSIIRTEVITKKEAQTMNMSESSRLILGLRAKGWSDTEITDFILWIGTGEEQYKPKNTD